MAGTALNPCLLRIRGANTVDRQLRRRNFFFGKSISSAVSYPSSATAVSLFLVFLLLTSRIINMAVRVRPAAIRIFLVFISLTHWNT